MRHSVWCKAPRAILFSSPRLAAHQQRARAFHAARALQVVKPFLLADIGEGIREVQIIQWFVQPGARVEEFDKLCEVQSDKASVEITSRYTGVVKRLHYDSDDMAIVGKPLIDIDIEGDVEAEDPREATTSENSEAASGQEVTATPPTPASPASTAQSNKYATLATPAVRHLTKELGVDISNIQGTGRDGRVTKEDVQKYAETRTSAQDSKPLQSKLDTASQEDTVISLTPIQTGMFKAMTKSLSIPHFLYSDSVDMQHLTSLRRRLRSQAGTEQRKVSGLAFILKAISLAFDQHPILNARVDTSDADKPKVVLRRDHNFGIAVDSPQGLLVPVIKRVQSLSIQELAAEISRLSAMSRDGKLTSKELSGGTFTVSNVGSIGGGVVSPVIVEGQTGIVGVGKSRLVPAFDADGVLAKREECVFSWSADHRVVDGATAARCAEVVKGLLERPEEMLVALR